MQLFFGAVVAHTGRVLAQLCSSSSSSSSTTVAKTKCSSRVAWVWFYHLKARPCQFITNALIHGDLASDSYECLRICAFCLRVILKGEKTCNIIWKPWQLLNAGEIIFIKRQNFFPRAEAFVCRYILTSYLKYCRVHMFDFCCVIYPSGVWIWAICPIYT